MLQASNKLQRPKCLEAKKNEYHIENAARHGPYFRNELQCSLIFDSDLMRSESHQVVQVYIRFVRFEIAIPRSL